MSTPSSAAPPDAGPVTVIHVGSRKSALALKQTDLIVSRLRELHPHLTAEVHGMATAGDKDQVSALYTMGKGLWTSELEGRLLAGELDMVVHSLKDLPTTMPAGCALGCISAREDPRDVLVVKASLRGDPRYVSLASLPRGSVVGTSSVRRVAQLRRRYPDLRFADARGNIQTRLAKLDADDSPFAALVLAAAGLLRMGYHERITQWLDGTVAGGGVLYAVGQGAMGVEVREGDERMLALLAGGVEDHDAMLACTAERAVMRALEGGCSVPIGVETEWTGEGPDRNLTLRTVVVSLDGTETVEGQITDRVRAREEADELGKRMATDLVERGAGKILDAINREKRGVDKGQE